MILLWYDMVLSLGCCYCYLSVISWNVLYDIYFCWVYISFFFFFYGCIVSLADGHSSVAD